MQTMTKNIMQDRTKLHVYKEKKYTHKDKEN